LIAVTEAEVETIWHDVECGAYGADLGLWSEIAREAGGPVLELGAGAGRVALHLAGRGHEVVALDTAPALLDALRRRARDSGLEIEAVVGDARELALERRFAAILAPMQLVHLLGGSGGRAAMLDAAAAHLLPGGAIAAALLDEDAAQGAELVGPPPLPDVRELGGWVYSSLPIEVAAVAGGLEVRRLRQIISPDGGLREATDAIRLDGLTADDFEAEAVAHGLRPRERLAVPPTADHVGSTICVLEAGR
jgi:SAM-dependent methyltransferase